jgi:DNA-binding NtrC family response regulator
VVDDEPGVVSAVRRELTAGPLGSYAPIVEGFTDTDEALHRAREVDFAVVLTDFRMPKRNGLEFLRCLRDIQPWIESIVLSGDTDIESLVSMINDTRIYRFIQKPWRSQVLCNSVVQAADLHSVGARHRKLAEMLAAAGIGLLQPVLPVGDTVLIIDDDSTAASAIHNDLMQTSLLFDILGVIDIGRDPGAAPVLDSTRLQVLVAGSAADALAKAREEPLSCIISDYRVGQDDGVELLAQLAECQPDASLLLLSAAPRMNELIRSLDVVRIQGYLTKPWVSHELRSAVAQALSYRRVQLENRHLAERLSRLPLPDRRTG